jgi:hypothetical protein
MSCVGVPPHENRFVRTLCMTSFCPFCDQNLPGRPRQNELSCNNERAPYLQYHRDSTKTSHNQKTYICGFPETGKTDRQANGIQKLISNPSYPSPHLQPFLVEFYSCFTKGRSSCRRPLSHELRCPSSQKQSDRGLLALACTNSLEEVSGAVDARPMINFRPI